VLKVKDVVVSRLVELVAFQDEGVWLSGGVCSECEHEVRDGTDQESKTGQAELCESRGKATLPPFCFDKII
jgi:hypothetical protein